MNTKEETEENVSILNYLTLQYDRCENISVFDINLGTLLPNVSNDIGYMFSQYFILIL